MALAFLSSDFSWSLRADFHGFGGPLILLQYFGRHLQFHGDPFIYFSCFFIVSVIDNGCQASKDYTTTWILANRQQGMFLLVSRKMYQETVQVPAHGTTLAVHLSP